jgi:CubicO group peptidase (beta-lactamase class C family)
LLVGLPTVLAAQTSLAPPAAFPITDRPDRLTAALPRIDSLLHAFAERERVPGIAYGVIVDGRLLHVRAAGLRHVSSNAPLDTSSVFRIASMTKSFTALAILQLRDAGLLALDEPAEQYIPELQELRYPTSDAPRITVRHLLTHSAGLPEDNPWGDRQLAATDEELATMLRTGVPFSNAPGMQYEYSNLGFALLGRIVQNVTGQPYATYMREQVLLPLGMTSTTMQAADVPAARLAHGYRVQDGRWLGEPPLPDGAFGAMGGMLTSASDLSRWVAFLLDAWPARSGEDSPVLSRASRREMQQVGRMRATVVSRDASGAPVLNAGGYGYGLGITQSCAFGHVVAHSGGLPGFGSLMRWLPEYGVGIIALGNRTYTGWGGVVDEAIGLLAATGGLVPREPQPSPVLLTMRERVSRLVQQWDQSLADRTAAMNLFLDEPAERRAAAIARLRDEAGGECRPDGPFVVENALRGQWAMQCRTGRLRVGITLAPTEPARVQQLTVRAMRPGEEIRLAAACRE